MKLIIDIHEKDYESLKNGNVTYSIIYAIKYGTPLPPGHGRLIDADDVENHIIGHVDLRGCPTIIEADRSKKE